MIWALVGGVPAALLLTMSILVMRRRDLEAHSEAAAERRRAREQGSHRARLQHPFVDLTRCIGCGLCVDACPEEQVLDLLHGQAVIVHGSRCVGHGRCAEACPVGAIALTLGDVSDRTDLPAINDEFEAIGTPGLFLAGEVTGYALVRTAITHGTAVADEIHRRTRTSKIADRGAHDLVIVGAGPAGLACSLRAKELGLRFVTVDQDTIGGTVARYPRRKLVMTQPVTLPLHGRLKQTTFVKEELIELWEEVARRHELPIRTGVSYRGLTRDEHGVFVVDTSEGPLRAHHVCLAIGRRGTPRRLGVPGEELMKVGYSLIDAHSYQDRRVLVVGGGDSAIEAAVGLAEQPGNQVTLSYRGGAFSRIKAGNERRLDQVARRHALQISLNSQVQVIDRDRVDLVINGTAPARVESLPNDDVFIFAGGVPPFALLEASGVSFSPDDRPPVDPVRERGPGLLIALAGALLSSLGVVGWACYHWSYYTLDLAGRIESPWHDLLRASGPVGLTLGVASVLAMLWNLCYLVRRARWGQWIPGSLSFWMSSHVLTGLLALLFVLVHSGFSARATVGGRALLFMSVVVGAGAIGRYLYSFVPRAANGRELALDETRDLLQQLSTEWEQRGSDFGTRVRSEIESLVERDRWGKTFVGRLLALVTGQRRVAKALAQLKAEGLEEGYTEAELGRWLPLAKRAHRAAVTVAHYEDLRALLGTWRYVHRWLALLLVLIVVVHIVAALRFADLHWITEWWGGGQ